MLDRRCHYKIRELNTFYLFIKHRKIYYAYYPQLKLTRSTKCTDLQDAYVAAWNIFGAIENKQNQLLYNPFTDKKRQRDLKRALSYIDQTKPLTETMIQSMQTKMLKEGLSGKSINNYIYILRRAYNGTFPPFKTVEHTATYRSCFPIKSFYGFYSKCTDRLHYLAFIAMTTGARLSELKTMEVDGDYLWINGTKTKNAKRRIPLLPQTRECLHYLEGGFRTTAYKESVVMAGNLCGFDANYIEENRIVFHSFRKMYKTLLESCNIPNSFIEYYMGHSQTNNVNQLYFIGSSADDSEVYPKVMEALRRFV